MAQWGVRPSLTVYGMWYPDCHAQWYDSLIEYDRVPMIE